MRSADECDLSHSAQVGHQDPGSGAVVSNHSSALTDDSPVRRVRTRWRRFGCTGPLMMPALWPPLVSRNVNSGDPVNLSSL